MFVNHPLPIPPRPLYCDTMHKTTDIYSILNSQSPPIPFSCPPLPALPTVVEVEISLPDGSQVVIKVRLLRDIPISDSVARKNIPSPPPPPSPPSFRPRPYPQIALLICGASC